MPKDGSGRRRSRRHSQPGERTVRAAARARGRKGGRPAKLSPKEIKTIRALLKTAEIPVAEVAARFGIARSTLYRAILEPGT
jgi:DNA invertase Pin-like site-specific DNA recombinase